MWKGPSLTNPFYGSINPFMTWSLHDLSTSLKTAPMNSSSVALAVKFPTHDFWGYIQIIAKSSKATFMFFF
jgi:hypothetical protein